MYQFQRKSLNSTIYIVDCRFAVVNYQAKAARWSLVKRQQMLLQKMQGRAGHAAERLWCWYLSLGKRPALDSRFVIYVSCKQTFHNLISDMSYVVFNKTKVEDFGVVAEPSCLESNLKILQMLLPGTHPLLRSERMGCSTGIWIRSTLMQRFATKWKELLKAMQKKIQFARGVWRCRVEWLLSLQDKPNFGTCTSCDLVGQGSISNYFHWLQSVPFL